MKIGTILKPGIIYYTKSGTGEVIKFNEGVNLETRARIPITPTETHTPNVWYAGISRHIKDIAETENDAKLINY